MIIEIPEDAVPPNFDLRAYESSRNLNLTGWYNNLNSRAWLLELMRHGDLGNHFPPNHIQHSLITLLIYPIITNKKLEDINDNQSNASLRIVQPVTMTEVLGTASDLKSGAWGDDIREMAEIYITATSKRIVEAQDALDKQLVEFHDPPLKSVKIEPIVWLSVDLNSSDSEIKDSFNLWLKNTRRNCDHDVLAKKRQRKLKQFSKPALQSWYANRILPYLDLMLWNEYMGSNLTDEMLGTIIFPEQGENSKANSHRDCTRAISDTVKPLAQQLISEKILTRMMNLI